LRIHCSLLPVVMTRLAAQRPGVGAVSRSAKGTR
jgi:hypothetical protein